MAILLPRERKSSPFERITGAVKGIEDTVGSVQRLTGTDAESRKKAELNDPNSPLMAAVREQAKGLGVAVPENLGYSQFSMSPLKSALEARISGKEAERLQGIKNVGAIDLERQKNQLAQKSKFDEKFAAEEASKLSNFQETLPGTLLDIQRLKAVEKQLAEPGELGGGILNKGSAAPGMIGKVAQFGRDIFDPKASQVHDDVRSVAQKSVKAVFGGNPSIQEGENLVRIAYNPAAGDDENRRRVTYLRQFLERGVEAKIAKQKWVEAGNSIASYRGPDPDQIGNELAALFAQFDAQDKKSNGVDKQPEQAQANQPTEEDMQALEEYLRNPNDTELKAILMKKGLIRE